MTIIILWLYKRPSFCIASLNVYVSFSFNLSFFLSISSFSTSSMMEVLEDERLLRFGLAIILDCGRQRKMVKRKRVESFESLDTDEVSEGKMLSLFETREMMLRNEDRIREATTNEEGKGLHLIHLLLVSATSLEEKKLDLTIKNLNELYKNVSLNGDSVQRVAAYFADGLLARLLTRRSPFHEMIMKDPTPEEEFSAYMELYKVSPYYQFAHFTANQMIMESFEMEEKENNQSLHVVDLDVGYGFQWPSLMQSLSEKATTGNRVSLRITGFGKTLEELEETKARLVGFAKSFRNLSFEFQGMLKSNTNSGVKLIQKNKTETLVINLAFYLHSLCSFSRISDLLKSICSLNPSVVVLIEQEAGRRPRTFLSRFIEFLHYYAAMFDSLDDFLPLDSPKRLQIEKNHLGKEIKRLIDLDTNELNSPKCETTETWTERMEPHGFEGMSLSSKSIIQAKLLLKINSHYGPIPFDGENGGFTVFEREEGNAISLAWQDKCLITASSWQCAGGR
ncbi:hypothetical protein QVD17_07525 [Tagetes erecta]|uniref:Uncharacterized protein n=1 Tax=Tagetes erecta TaxID=13708 RepID=A0AAD8PCY4_TARER|nr:hypothetical protein QVD17_07525 [Tagetes erecta]